jgi:DNA-binding transcriptional regulator GbsR (MarR family)
MESAGPQSVGTPAANAIPVDAAFLDIIGDLVEQWGFNRHSGSIWALLYLGGVPMSARQLQATLNLSAGSVHSLLNELQTWGAVHRLRVAGDRNTYYEPQMPIWQPVTNVLRSRELRILSEARQRLDQLQQRLVKGGRGARHDEQLQKLQRVAALLNLAASIGELLVNAPIERLERLASFMQKLRNL